MVMAPKLRDGSQRFGDHSGHSLVTKDRLGQNVYTGRNSALQLQYYKLNLQTDQLEGYMKRHTDQTDIEDTDCDDTSPKILEVFILHIVCEWKCGPGVSWLVFAINKMQDTVFLHLCYLDTVNTADRFSCSLKAQAVTEIKTFRFKVQLLSETWSDVSLQMKCQGTKRSPFPHLSFSYHAAFHTWQRLSTTVFDS